jgi:hypothetical protein
MVEAAYHIKAHQLPIKVSKGRLYLKILLDGKWDSRMEKLMIWEGRRQLSLNA